MAEAISSRTKLLLISHLSAWSGEVLPVKEVGVAARAKGVAVLVDAAQSVGLLDVKFNEMQCDFLAASLHKWLASPMGTGALIMRPEHLGNVLPLHPPLWDTSKYPTDLYEWTGTFNMAAYASVADALAFFTDSRCGSADQPARIGEEHDLQEQGGRIRWSPGLIISKARIERREIDRAVEQVVEGMFKRARMQLLRERSTGRNFGCVSM